MENTRKNVRKIESPTRDEYEGQKWKKCAYCRKPASVARVSLGVSPAIIAICNNNRGIGTERGIFSGAGELTPDEATAYSLPRCRTPLYPRSKNLPLALLMQRCVERNAK